MAWVCSCSSGLLLGTLGRDCESKIVKLFLDNEMDYSGIIRVNKCEQ